ncbi:TetR/AcrR family transcriptional regulator [Paracoccus gahaiensis]|uniref:TetR/AcrR family transcriptional regulator n=1 Tax=Paracoccus gahaiensis TaxID=1706839 RepID=A0A4V5MVC8_9RHOB|nr:TetR/AcrR family transcriptional regulator [Paracoccus gahaiensis]TJZ91238.1 TetR/AcrR family transcriptional regulator [Paracoccus gahaiensis]
MVHERKAGKSRGGRPSLEHAADIDARILSAAAALFIERGVDGTSLEAVATAAAVSKPTLYARYADKSGLFVAVIRAHVAAALPPIEGSAAGTSPEQRLRQVGRAVIEGALQPVPLGLMRLYIAEVPRHGDLVREVDRLGREAALKTISSAIADPEDADSVDRAQIIAAAFLDLVFVPHQMRALLGDLPDDADPLHPALDERIETAVTFFRSTGLLASDRTPERSSGPPGDRTV